MAPLFETGAEFTDRVIGVGDLGVVVEIRVVAFRGVCQAVPELGSGMWQMGIQKMDVQEERTRRSIDELQCSLGNLLSAPASGLGVDLNVFETAREAASCKERLRGHQARLKTGASHQLGRRASSPRSDRRVAGLGP